MYDHVIAKFSLLGRLLHFLTHGAPLLKVFVKVLQDESWHTILGILVLPFRRQKDQSNLVSSPCNNKVRSKWAGFFFLLKPAFKKASTTMIAFGLKECSHHLMVPRQGNAMAEMSAVLVAST